MGMRVHWILTRLFALGLKWVAKDSRRFAIAMYIKSVVRVAM